MNNERWWAVYRGCQYIGSIKAVSGERALDVVAERHSILLAELDAVDEDAMERSGLGLLRFFSMELGPEFSEPGPAIPDAGPTMRAVPWAQTEARVSARPDPIPDAGPTPADMRGEVVHERA
jgi:hypothetical protein